MAESVDIAALRALLEKARPFVGWDGPSHSIHQLVDVLSVVIDELERLRADVKNQRELKS